MKRAIVPFLFLLLLSVNCYDSGNDDRDLMATGLLINGQDGYTGVAFRMVQVPLAVDGVFYSIGETEVTYELWKAVHDWAVSPDRGADAYHFVSKSIIGSHDTGSEQQPVTTISWRDAVVWCNALTEYYNATSSVHRECVYTSGGEIIRSTGGACDSAEVNAAAAGFRLPTNNEWLMAARYIDDKNGNGTLEPGEYYPQYYPSGGDADCYVTTGASDIDGDGIVRYIADVAVYKAKTTAVVKSRAPNKLGIYDMSGNVDEWCFDMYAPSTPYRRGGNYFESASSSTVEHWSYSSSSSSGYYLGFRVARTIPESSLGANVAAAGRRRGAIIAVGAAVLALATLGGIFLYRRRRRAA
ncbi:MAG: SUMF1/EgtB/PvdO family nonheme iron enzyme [Spirochaetes bacterium]|nr:SUMF1/EgtB/PvdO family nonheme iron enzyme [Spirochaetota bacterium]